MVHTTAGRRDSLNARVTNMQFTANIYIAWQAKKPEKQQQKTHKKPNNLIGQVEFCLLIINFFFFLMFVLFFIYHL